MFKIKSKINHDKQYDLKNSKATQKAIKKNTDIRLPVEKSIKDNENDTNIEEKKPLKEQAITKMVMSIEQTETNNEINKDPVLSTIKSVKSKLSLLALNNLPKKLITKQTVKKEAEIIIEIEEEDEYELEKKREIEDRMREERCLFKYEICQESAKNSLRNILEEINGVISISISFFL